MKYPGSQRRFQTWISVLTESWCMDLNWMLTIRYIINPLPHFSKQNQTLLKWRIFIFLRFSLSGFQGQCLSEKAKVFCRSCHGLQTVSFDLFKCLLYLKKKSWFLWSFFCLFPVEIPFLVLSSHRRKWRLGVLCTGSSTSCTPPTPAGNTWRTCHCCPNIVNVGRTTSLSWKMCHASSEVNYQFWLKYSFNLNHFVHF